MPTADQKLTLSKAESWEIFNAISPRYDLLNRILSFGQDILWRNQLKKFLPNKNSINILDLATGTGDVLLTLMKKNPRIQAGYGVDMADKMLEIGKEKVRRSGFQEKIILEKGDANSIPFGRETFDCVTIAFGIRNMTDPGHVLREIRRVLKPGGRALILEFSLPKNSVFRAGYLFYLRNIVPLIGFLVSGHYAAYRYLNQTIEDFPYGEKFCGLMQTNGFQNLKAHPLLFGVATIYEGEKI